MGCRLWGRIESDTTEATQQQQRRIMFLGPFAQIKKKKLFLLIVSEKTKAIYRCHKDST